MAFFSKLQISLLAREFLVYVFIGGICTVTDLGIFYGLTENGLPVSYAAIISFSLAAIFNYILCVKLLFNKKKHAVHKELLLTFIVSAIGLLLSVGIIYGLINFFYLYPMGAKIISIPIVLLWNFLSRKFFVFL